MNVKSGHQPHGPMDNIKRCVNLTSSQSNLVDVFVVGSTEVEVNDAPGRPFE